MAEASVSRAVTERRLRWVALVLGLTVLFGYTVRIVGLSPAERWPTGMFVLLVAAALVGSAGDRLRLALGIVFPPLAVATVSFWTRERVGAPEVAEGVWWALLLTPVIATAGYAAGRAVFRTGDTARDTFLLGRDVRVSRRWLAGGAVLTVLLSLALVALALERMAVREPPEPAGVTPLGVFGAAFVAVATAPLTAVLAYRNDGIVVCWLVAFLPALGVTVVTMLFPVYLPVERVLHDLERAVAFACVAGVLGGTVGFGLGVGGRRLLRGLGALRGDSERPPHDGS